MKKSLLALAVLGAFAGVASAQTSVTVYGVLDMAIQHENNGVNSKTALDSGIQSGSRLGFKGVEDLGGGMNAHFVLEMGVNADNGTSAQGGLTFGRQAYVGLGGNFGNLNMGRQYSPIFNSAASVDPWGVGIIGATAGVGTSATGILGMFGTPFRTNNTINYTTNNLSGFTGSLAYSFGEQAGDNTAGRQMGLSGSYANGPVLVTAAYHKANDTTAATKATKLGFVGGSYDFKVAKLAAAYGTNKVDAGADNRTWMLGATVPVGPATNILASYARNNDRSVADGATNQIALGFTYSLSKRTNFYGSVSRTANDAGVSGGGLSVAKGDTDKMYNVGIRHTF